MQDDECFEPQELTICLEKLKKHKPDAVILDSKKWDELRRKKLKANLKKVNEDFDESRFIPSTDYEIETSSNDVVDYGDAY